MIRSNRFCMFWIAAVREFRSISSSYSILLVLVGGVFAYGFLYNYMYAPNVVYEIPIAVVGHSNSSLSRQYVRWMDATPQVCVTDRAIDMDEAKRLMRQAEVFGILYLPGDFEERLFSGNASVYSYYATTDAFLYYEALEKANLQVMEAMDVVYRPQLIENLSIQEMVSVAAQSPVKVVGTALYNPIEGYGIYLIPSVLMLIIFQTMMMLVAMRTGGERVSCRAACHTETLCLLLGKVFVYCMLYAVFAFFMFGLLPLVFNLPHMASWWELLLLMIPYLLSTAFLGFSLSRWYTDAEAPILCIAFFSVGLIFLSGVSYPLELMPWYWQMVHYILPATVGTLAFVQLNCMDASIGDVLPALVTLWVQVFLYFLLALYNYRRKT